MKAGDETEVVEWPMECETAAEHVSRCVGCERLRREEDRREPESEVCVQCEREAGFAGVEGRALRDRRRIYDVRFTIWV